jgi:hypothetical protein
MKQGYRKLADFRPVDEAERYVLARALATHDIPMECEFYFDRTTLTPTFTRICVPARDLQCALVLYRTIRANRGAA